MQVQVLQVLLHAQYALCHAGAGHWPQRVHHCVRIQLPHVWVRSWHCMLRAFRTLPQSDSEASKGARQHHLHQPRERVPPSPTQAHPFHTIRSLRLRSRRRDRGGVHIAEQRMLAFVGTLYMPHCLRGYASLCKSVCFVRSYGLAE